MRITILAFILLISTSTLFSQIKVYEKFDDFEKELLQPTNDDTLYVINFWATWCIPCVKELPYFEQLNQKYKNEKVKIILVSLDFTTEQVINFINKKNIKNEVVLLTDSKTNTWIEKVDSSWSGAIPITLFLKGKQKDFHEKDYHNLEELETDLLKLKTIK